MIATKSVLTIGQIADHFHQPLWRMQYLCRIGKLPPTVRVGHFRTFTEDDLPAIEQVLRDGGYIKTAAGAC